MCRRLVSRNVLGKHGPGAPVDHQISQRQSDRGAEPDGSRIDRQAQDASRKKHQPEHGKVCAFIGFQNKITKNKCD